MVTALSTLPCFLVDKCLFSGAEAECGCSSCQDDGDGCHDCCSPFMHCTTCPGCTRPATVLLATVVTPAPHPHYFIYDEDTVMSFKQSVWQPPRR